MSAGADTRERILAVSTELFMEQGYDSTSLRQIAERLGFTKAALYYHFSSKEQILAALFQPVQELIAGLMERLDAARTIEDWADALEWVVDNVFTHGDMFRLIARNRHAVEGFMTDAIVGSGDPNETHLLMHERAEFAAEKIAKDIGEHVRMIAALGAVTGFDDWAPTLLQTGPPDVLAAELAAATRRILGVKARRR